MRTRWLAGGVVPAALLLVGCGGTELTADPDNLFRPAVRLRKAPAAPAAPGRFASAGRASEPASGSASVASSSEFSAFPTASSDRSTRLLMMGFAEPAIAAAAAAPAAAAPAEKPADAPKPAGEMPAMPAPMGGDMPKPMGGDAPKPGDLPKTGETPAVPPGSATPEPPAEPPPPSEKRFLMHGLEALGYKDALYDALRIDFRGYVEQSFTWNVGNPSDRRNALRFYDDRSNDYRFNSLFFQVERALKPGTDFDIGGRFTGQFGMDARFNQSKGLMDREFDDEGRPNLFQFAPLEFYGDIRLPIGNGFTTRVGKFFTPVGVESIDSSVNQLYSRGHLFNLGPFTHTGVLMSYPILMNEARDAGTLVLKGGPFLGWDTFKDDNRGITGYFGVEITPSDEVFIGLNYLVGPEQTGIPDSIRSFFDTVLIITPKAAPRLTLITNWDIGTESDGRVSGDTADDRAVGGPGEAFFTGIAQYVTYKLGPDDRPEDLAATLRVEWYNDAHGNRTINYPGSVGYPGNHFDFTFGLNWNPRIYRGDGYYYAPIIIRPEARWDYYAGGGAAPSIERPYQNRSLSHQFTVAINVLVKF
jgi:hypothetical protein